MNTNLGIIVPVYNESENIRSTIKAMEEQIATPHRIYIVYDFDEDTTIPPARALLNEGAPIEFVKNSTRGVVNAIKTGLRKAEEPYLLVTMADLSDDFSVVDQMCRLMADGNDLVCGSRYMKGGKQIGGPLLKKTISRIAGTSLWTLAGIPTHDVTNSFKLYRKSMVEDMVLQSDGGFEVGMEIVVKAHFSGFKITEIPCTWRDRQQGKSNFKLMKWLPKYLKWYFYALKKRLFR